MAHRDRELPDERLVARHQHRALDLLSSDRIRPIAYDDRKAARPGPAPAEAKPLALGDLAIDPARREVTLKGRPVVLRSKEFDLLLALAQHKGLVLTREQLLDLVWGYDFYGQTRTVDVHVAHLRNKLAGSGVTIETVWGVGYKLLTS